MPTFVLHKFEDCPHVSCMIKSLLNSPCLGIYSCGSFDSYLLFHTTRLGLLKRSSRPCYLPVTIPHSQSLHKMAISTLSPQPVPNPLGTSTSVPPATQSGRTILDEVRAAQSHLRTRLAGALTTPPPNVPPSLLPTVPLIDLGPSFDPGTPASRHAVAQEIREACLTTGFFQIRNHGITTSATEGILAQAKR